MLLSAAAWAALCALLSLMQTSSPSKVEYRHVSFLGHTEWEDLNPKATRSPYSDALLLPEFACVERISVGCFNLATVDEWRKKNRPPTLSTCNHTEARAFIRKHLRCLISEDKYHHDQNSQVDVYFFDSNKADIIVESPARKRHLIEDYGDKPCDDD